MSNEPSGVLCPNCSHPFSLQMVAKAKSESKMSFRLSPAPGELLDIQTLVGSAGAFGKLLVAVGKDLGYNTVVLVDRIFTEEDGALRIDVMIARSDSKTKKQLSRKATREAVSPFTTSDDKEGK